MTVLLKRKRPDRVALFLQQYAVARGYAGVLAAARIAFAFARSA